MEQNEIIRPCRPGTNRLGLAFLVFLLVVLAVQSAASIILPRVAPALVERDWYLWLLSSLPIYLFGLPVCLLLLRPVPSTPPCPRRSLTAAEVFLALVICFGMMMIGNLIGQAMMRVVSIITGTPLENPLNRMILDMHPLISAIFTVIVAPIGEEFIFRRLVIDRARRFGELQAVLLSGALFGAFHMNFFQFFYAFFLGLIFGYIYLKTGRLRHTIFLHAAINLAGGVIAPALIRVVLPLLESFDGGMPDPASLLPVLPALLAYLAYAALLSASAIATVVLGILLRRKITFAKAPQSARPLWLNFGMIAFFAVCALFAAAGIF